MPDFFFWSKDGDANFVVQRLLREGHNARVYIHHREAKDVGRGLVPLVNSPVPRRGEVVFFDMVGFGKQADLLKRQGFKVIGGSRIADQLENDRPFAYQITQGAGMATPETRVMKNIGEARKFLLDREPGEGWYLKPSGDEDAASTFGAKDIPDMLRHIASLERKRRVPKKPFLLQKKMDNKAELSFEGWFDGKRWVLPWNSTIEDKKFMPGDLGGNTGCMANLVWAYEDQMPLLAMRTLTRLAPVLKAGDHRGPVDVNVIFDEEGVPHWLEYTMRPGYIAYQALLLLTGGDLGAQLWEFANGTLERFEVMDDRYALTINVSVPPYPNHHAAKDARWTPLDPDLLLDPIRIMPTDVMVEDGVPYITGSDGGVATFGDTGTRVSDLRTLLLERIKEYAIPNAQYRNDPVARAEEELDFLASKGYETPHFGETPAPPRRFELPGPEGRMDNDFTRGRGDRNTDSGMSVTLTHADTDDLGKGPTFN